MSKLDLAHNQLLDQSVALKSYMQELLNEVTWTEPEPDEKAVASREIIPEPVYDSPEVITVEEALINSSVKRQTLAELEAEYEVESVPVAESESEPADLRPDWAQGSFRALYAIHGRLKMLLPLVHVKTVARASELVRVDGPLTTFVGYIQQGTERIPVLDLNCLNGASEKTGSDDNINVSDGYVALAENSSVGLYFESISDTQEVDSDMISWSCSDESASWMAGVNPETLAIVVDINSLCDLL